MSKATKRERRYMTKVAALGCIVPECQAEANIHHIRTGYGGGQKAPHQLVIPLCKEHHQGDFSIHGSPREFQNVIGSELDLLAQTIDMLNP